MMLTTMNHNRPEDLPTLPRDEKKPRGRPDEPEQRPTPHEMNPSPTVGKNYQLNSEVDSRSRVDVEHQLLVSTKTSATAATTSTGNHQSKAAAAVETSQHHIPGSASWTSRDHEQETSSAHSSSRTVAQQTSKNRKAKRVTRFRNVNEAEDDEEDHEDHVPGDDDEERTSHSSASRRAKNYTSSSSTTFPHVVDGHGVDQEQHAGVRQLHAPSAAPGQLPDDPKAVDERPMTTSRVETAGGTRGSCRPSSRSSKTHTTGGQHTSTTCSASAAAGTQSFATSHGTNAKGSKKTRN
ncbi:unnamed protein product, partial [Amoebophrya sp. A120]|eukprot:GSA120T00002100001.1